MINLDKLIHPEATIQEIGRYVFFATLIERSEAISKAIRKGRVGIDENGVAKKYTARVNVNQILREILPKLGNRWDLKLLKKELAIEGKRFREEFSGKVADQLYLTLNEVGTKKDFDE